MVKNQGIMMAISSTNQSRLTMVILLTATVLFGCDSQQNSASGPTQEMPPMPVSVLSVTPTSVPISIESVAQTEGAKEVEIRPRVGGILLKKLFEEGAEIKAGQAMFLIDPVPFQIALAEAKAMLSEQKTKVAQAEREANRLEKLLEMQSISAREADNANSDYALAKASLAQYEAKVREAELNLSYTKVTSPITGVAGRFVYSEGALVEANNSLLTTVSKNSPIWVRFSLSDSELEKLGGHVSEANVRPVELIMQNGQPYASRGKLNFAASTVNPSLGTQELRATFENAGKMLMPGQFVRVRISTGDLDGVFKVPQTAVLSGEQGKFVFVVDDKQQATPRPVRVGDWVGTDWVVESGLNAGDQVIVDNLIKIRPGAKVNPHPVGEPVQMPQKPVSQ